MRLVALCLLAAAPALAAAPRTFRVDYFHTGSGAQEFFSLDRLVIEPLPWPGNPARAIDDTDSGKYRFLVRDGATKTLLYSRGFSSIFGEWEETPDAKERARTFEESLRFPLPGGPVEVTLEKRNRSNAFVPVWTFRVDPKDQTVSDAAPDSPGPLIPLLKNGPPESKVDLLILGDGYTHAQRAKFEQDARRLVAILFSKSPFKERKQDFNVWGLCPESREAGISRPSTGVHRRSRIGATYDAFGSERYILTFDNRSFRDVASFAPYEFVEILVNGNTYGGGGIFGLYSTVAADSFWSPYVFVHEFGHHFAGLADEYFTSESAYLPAADRTEPWEPNVTALKDPAALKWKALVSPGTPVPTPWRKEEFETYSRAIQVERKKIRAERRPESEMDALFSREKKEVTRILGTDQYSGKVGAFEGAMYESRGYFRPQEDCIMFTRDEVPFCRVCQAAISRIIDFYAQGSRVIGVALVALGGALGSVARYGVGALAAQLLGASFPWGTLLVNLTGSFLIALVMHLALTGTAVSLEMRIFLTTGILGGFTTYSSFNYETLALLNQRAYWLAGVNLATTVVGCLVAGVLGLATGRALVGG